jgi:hypothetical protein
VPSGMAPQFTAMYPIFYVKGMNNLNILFSNSAFSATNTVISVGAT